MQYNNNNNNNNNQIDDMSLNGFEIDRSRNGILIAVILGNDLNLDAHIKSLCRKAAQNLSALYRKNKSLSYDQKLQLVNSAVKS